MLIFFIAAYGMTMVSMETGSDTYINKDNARGILFDKYTDTYQSDMILLVIETDNVLDTGVLRYMNDLQRDISDESYVASATSITDLLKEMNGGSLPTSSAEIIHAKEVIPEEYLARYLPSNMMSLIAITLEPGTTHEVREQVLNNIDSIISISNPPPGVTITVTGNPAFQKEMQEEMGTSMGVLIGAAMLLMVLAVGVLFSHIRYRFLPVLIVAAGLIATFGVMGFAGIRISMVVIGAFPVLIGIGIDYAIQFQSRFDEEMRRSSVSAAVRTTIMQSGPAIFYAMVATSLGFAAMWLSPIPMVRDFGLICIIGVFCCYAAALIAVPTFGILVGYTPKTDPGVTAGNHHMEKYDTLLGSIAVKIAKNPVPLVLALCFIAFVGIQLDATIPVNSDEETFVPSDMPAVLNLKKVTRTMGATQTLPIYLRGDGLLSPDALEWMAGFQEYEVAHNDKITSSTSIVTYLKHYNGGTLPSNRHEIDAVMERIPDSVKNRYVSGTMESVIEFSIVDMEMDATRSLLNDIKKDLEWYRPPAGIAAAPTGTLELFTSLMDDITQGKTRMTLLGFGLIFAFLVLVYRKVTAISPIIPIIFIVGWNGLVLYLLGIEYTPLTATLGSMTIGIASEYTILIMERYQEERELGMDVYEAIQTSVSKIGTAITVSGMTTLLGFSALLLSSFNIIKNFGLVTVITVGFSLAGAIFAMPAILSLMSRVRGDGVHAEGSP